MHANAVSQRTGSWAHLDVAELQVRYLSYRRRQATRLVHLLPKEAIRPLYRRAAEAARGRGEDPGDDPLACLLELVERLLPLPPFEVWRADLVRHPDAHLADLEEAVDGPSADAPSTLAMRVLEYGDRTWRALLRGYRDGDVWRGYIAYHTHGDPRTHRTAPVFCESAPADLVERFHSFEPVALEAFLRSSLP